MNRLTNYWTSKAHEVGKLVYVGAAMLETDTIPKRVVQAKLPGDPLALRGIPVTGRSIAGGAIRGTRPEVQVLWLDADRMAS